MHILCLRSVCARRLQLNILKIVYSCIVHKLCPKPSNYPVCFKRHIFPREFFRNASVHLWATHFHIFWCTHFKKCCSHVNLYRKKEVPRRDFTTPRSQLLDKIRTKFKRLPTCFRGQGIQQFALELSRWPVLASGIVCQQTLHPHRRCRPSAND